MIITVPGTAMKKPGLKVSIRRKSAPSTIRIQPMEMPSSSMGEHSGRRHIYLSG
jgi:hypothetical protein